MRIRSGKGNQTVEVLTQEPVYVQHPEETRTLCTQRMYMLGYRIINKVIKYGI